MEISLRRASAIQTAIAEAMKSIVVSPATNLSLFDNFAEKLDIERTALLAAQDRKAGLITVLYNIRRAVSGANVQNGIDHLLAEQAELGALIELSAALAAGQPKDAPELIQKRADRLASREEPTSHYGRSSGPIETLSVNLLTEQDIEREKQHLQSLKRRRTEVKDRLAEQNAIHRIQLTPETVEILKAEGLI